MHTVYANGCMRARGVTISNIKTNTRPKDITLTTVMPALKPSAQRNETETKQFQNCFETVLKQFCIFVSAKM